MTTFSQLVDEVLMIVKGYGLHQYRGSYLTGSLSASGTSVSVGDAADFDRGIAEIEDELVIIDSVDRANAVVSIVPKNGRGQFGTTATTHAVNERIEFNPPWPRHRVKQVINDTILSTYPTLFGVGTTSFTYNPSVTTYELPAAAERVLHVQAQTLGPSDEMQQVNRYKFSSVAPTSDFASGNIITLQESVAPGRTVTVTYLQAPVELSADDDDFTDSGLRQSAKLAVVYGACSNLLAFMDVARLPVDAASADEYDERNAVGAATRIANQLYTRFQMELEQERKRLRSTTPVPINVRNR